MTAGMKNFYCLAITYQSGVPIADGLKILQTLEKSHGPHDMIKSLYQEVHAGLALHIAMSKQIVFPKYILQIIQVGEETGKLGHCLYRLESLLRKDIEGRIIKITKLIEPMSVILLGAFISFIIISIYLPLFNLSGLNSFE